MNDWEERQLIFLFITASRHIIDDTFEIRNKWFEININRQRGWNTFEKGKDTGQITKYIPFTGIQEHIFHA